jgi:hypothetical protein
MSSNSRQKMTRRRALQSGAGLAVGGVLGSSEAAGAGPPSGKAGVYEALGVKRAGRLADASRGRRRVGGGVEAVRGPR